MNVELTRLTEIYPNGVFVQWSVTGTSESGDFLVDVYRSGSPEGPWTPLTVGAINIYNYYDIFPITNPDAVTESVNTLSVVRGIFYRVVVTSPGSVVAEAVSDVAPRLKGRFKLIKRKMLRDQAVAYRRLNGTEIAILKRRRWGPRCPDCFDVITKEQLRSECTTCFSTSYAGGYYTPIVTVGRRTVLQRDQGMTPMNTTETNVAQFWLLDVPYVEVDDIIVGLRDGRRYKITKYHNTELQTVTVHQKVDVTEMPRSSIEYRITVDTLRIPPLF